jgi:hypothetical protein
VGCCCHDRSRWTFALNAGRRVQADPQAAAHLERYITFDGRLTIPVLSMHMAIGA